MYSPKDERARLNYNPRDGKKRIILVHKRLGERIFTGFEGTLQEWLSNGWKIKS